MTLLFKIVMGIVMLIIKKTLTLSKEQKVHNPIHKYVVLGCYILFLLAIIRSVLGFETMSVGDHAINNLPLIFWLTADILFPILIVIIAMTGFVVKTLKMKREVKKLLLLTESERKFLDGKIMILEIKRFGQEESSSFKILIGIAEKKLILKNLNLTPNANGVSFEVETTFLILHQIRMMMEMRSLILKKEIELYKDGIEETHHLLKQRFELSEKSTLFFNKYGFRPT